MHRCIRLQDWVQLNPNGLCAIDWNGNGKNEHPPICRIIEPKRTVCGLKVCGCQLLWVKATIGDNQLCSLHTADGYFSKIGHHRIC